MAEAEVLMPLSKEEVTTLLEWMPGIIQVADDNLLYVQASILRNIKKKLESVGK